MPSRERNRRVLPLPRFEPRFTFDRSLRRIDKIELNFDIASISPSKTRGEVFASIRNISRTHPVFRREQLKDGFCLRIRKYPLDFVGTQGSEFLLSGQVRVFDQTVRAILTLNPTRFITHNPPNRRLRDNAECLVQDMQISVDQWRHSLEGNDNFIPSNRLAEVRLIKHTFHLRRYLAAIHDLLRQEISALFGGEGIRYHDDFHNWTVKAIELYWEFSAPHAPCATRDMGEFLCRHYHSISRRFPLSNIDNNQSITFYVFKNTKPERAAIMYAKTNERVRLEYRFLENPRIIYSKETRGWNNLTLNGLIDLVEFITTKAIQELAPLSFATQNYSSTRSVSSIDLVSDVCALISTAQTYNMSAVVLPVVRDLLLSGRTIEILGDPNRNNFLAHLCRKGVLLPFRKSGGRRIYVVSNSLQSYLAPLIASSTTI